MASYLLSTGLILALVLIQWCSLAESGVVVIDNGSGWMKAGMAGDGAPTVTFRTVVGYPKGRMPGSGTQFYVGDDAIAKRGVITIRSPMNFGIITNFDEMIKIWAHTFKQLKVNPSEHSVVLTAQIKYKIFREKIVKIMFDHFRVQAVYIATESSLSLYSAGLTTGTVVTSGYEISTALSIKNRNSLAETARITSVGGDHVTEYLMVLTGYNYGSTDLMNDIKEATCYVALDYQKELQNGASPKDYEWFETITLKDERFKASEVLFQPRLGGKDEKGIHEIAAMSADIQPILLAGGSTMLPGIAERLQKEVSSLVGTTVKVLAPANRQYSAWIGGAKFASQPDFSQRAISSAEYSQVGAAIVNTKCKN